MFKLFGRKENGSATTAKGGSGDPFDVAPYGSQQKRVSSNIAEVEFVGPTAVATLTLTDLCSSGSAQALADLLDEMVSSGTRHFVLDMQNVQSVDSSCLGCLVEACNRLAESGGKIALANAAKTVQQVVKLTRLDRIFPVCQDVMSAIKVVERDAQPIDEDMETWP